MEPVMFIVPPRTHPVTSPHVASVFGEPADFAAVVAPVWSKSDSCGYHLSENPVTANEKPQESE